MGIPSLTPTRTHLSHFSMVCCLPLYTHTHLRRILNPWMSRHYRLFSGILSQRCEVLEVSWRWVLRGVQNLPGKRLKAKILLLLNAWISSLQHVCLTNWAADHQMTATRVFFYHTGSDFVCERMNMNSFYREKLSSFLLWLRVNGGVCIIHQGQRRKAKKILDS